MKLVSKIVVVSVVASLGGCVTTAPRSTERADASGQPCNAVAAAVGGALVGALLGGKKDRLAGAVVGGTLASAACMAVNYRANQVKTAQQVNQEFQSRSGGRLPEHATLVRYETRFDPTDTVRGGGSSKLVSYIEVAQGRDGVRPSIEEEITLFGPDGKPIKNVRKAANAGASAGAFQGQFSFVMPEGVPQGFYPFKTALYVDGKMVSASQARLQVVSLGTNQVVASQ